MLTAACLQSLCTLRFDRFRVPLKCRRDGEEWTAVSNVAAILYLRGRVEHSAPTDVPLWKPLMQADPPSHRAAYADILGWCRQSVERPKQCPECYGLEGHWAPAPYCGICMGLPLCEQDWCEVYGGEYVDRGMLLHYLQYVDAKSVTIAWPDATRRAPLVLRPNHGEWIFCAMPAVRDRVSPTGDPFPRGIIEPTNSQEGDEVR